MKTPEDEAFDDLAKRQGAWGGGFKAKQAMAADKLQEDLTNYGTAWSQDGKRIDPMSVYKEPAQQPVGEIRASSYGHYPVVAWANGYVAKIGDKFYTTPQQRERVVFPTMLRKMWSGGEVQAWLDENVNKEKNA